MIHQLIFAAPKPGMSEKEFQRYWREKHAPIASKIPQIKRYSIASRIPLNGEKPVFSGVAEIWLENEKEELESLQSKEFLQGARIDEPNWAAFWQTLALDTTAHVLMEGEPLKKQSGLVKVFTLLKRKPGVSLSDFRQYWLETHGPLVLSLPGVRRYLQCHVNDGLYALGESRFDGVEQVWFDDTISIEKMMNSAQYKEKVLPDLANFVELKYVFSFVADEYWVIGPESR
ncbi:MAG: EthD domain-containing protein [Pleurocapsa sp. MO_192.B19]|nr:EthD domain-containing protein [Pleurocapsa sp. MO_192.B19]